MPERIVFHQEAMAELHEAALYYEAQASGLGTRFGDEVRIFLERILANPTRFAVRTGEVRRANLKRFPYHLNYLIDGERIAVVAIAHDRRRPFYWRERLAQRDWMEG